ncbi:hypothetical protein X769_13750 [Mesorhizobium sp. LSJC268A00]|uniref:hypothetical protein n=1 Tax=unclassified Mesorhizobium TaxID=325217 RepID=UPI0003CDDCAB|nr:MULTISPECIES: hypothetical protein [unclassified Mesorhizobium]ESX04862.1 hypothetical protein X769_13750 [Mesorhizobium sp. LSJC268A00]ESX46882.1 hypothetical protein X762_20220 [Mesorhizobium sp. LSHC426A00]ESX57015.1 hypothetical protein X760_22715 [Mesorhizobium sp. LSHC422A00]ESX59248.1 hypothetical protein X761_00550 [Mesorhizobium sp. LSHC424B00]ESX72297.1 hypothetical protein X758_12540 [Mesorhizobium sp. LSHC416B00]
MSQFVATTTLSLMRSLGSTAERSVHRLQAVLGREFPGGIGLELAEPVPRKDGSGIDWYTERDEPLVRLTDLPPETASVYKARLDQSVRAVLRAAAAHEARTDPAARSTATALRNAVTFPDDENVWVSGGSDGSDGVLVLTAWGYEKHDAETSGKGQIAEAARDRPPTASVADTATERPVRSAGPAWWQSVARRLLWLVPVALAGATAWLLLPACGLVLPFGVTAFGKGGGAYCALAAPQPTVDHSSLRTRELMSEEAVIEEQLRRHLNSCQPPAPAPRAEQTDPAQEADNRVESAGGAEGQTQVTLIWNNRTDLDLFVKCPDGGMVLLDGQPKCGGVHDIDMNLNGESTKPVEHITWASKPPPGHYEVYLRMFNKRGDPARRTDFNVILKKGDATQSYPGSVTEESHDATQMKVMEFNVP